MVPTTEFLAALEDWAEAMADYRKCVAGCDASPGYFCSRQLNRLDDATHRLERAFKAAVVEAVKEAISADV